MIEDEDDAPYPGGVQAIAQERARQLDLGYDEAHDAQHRVHDLVAPAVHLLGGETSSGSFRLRPANPNVFAYLYVREDLVRAGALIAAAIDRLDNAPDIPLDPKA